MAFIQKQGYWISENGWRMCDAAELDYTPIPGTNFKLGVRKGAPNIILKSAIWRLNQIEPMIVTQIGCYTDSNSMANSNHNSASAFDYNWNKHQYQKWGTWGSLRPAVDQMVKDFRGILEFGGDWTSPRDEMHFELHFAEGHAGTEALAKDLLNGLWGIWAPGGTPPVVVIPDGCLQLGSEGDDVRKLQVGMNKVFPNYKAMPLDVDGIFGAFTESAVKEFQSRSLIGVDGIVGSETKERLATYGIVLSGATTPTTPPIITPQPPQPPQKKWPQTASDRDLLEYCASQLGPGDPSWPIKLGENEKGEALTVRDRLGLTAQDVTRLLEGHV